MSSSILRTVAAVAGTACLAGCGGDRLPESTAPAVTMAPATAASPAAGSTAGSTAVDADLPVYEPASGISGNLSSVGSDTMNNLMTLWGETFSRTYPNVKLQVEGKGS